jgi:hypothetical protein
MTYKAKLKVHFDTEWARTGGVYDDETLPEEHYTFEIPVQDLNTVQLFRFFGTIARTMGHIDRGIMKGAAALAFNDMRSEEDMRKIAEEFDLILVEDHRKKLEEYDAQQDRDLQKLESEIRDLKAKLSRCENPDNPNYTTEEMDAMSYEEK